MPNFLGRQCPIIYNVTYRRKLGANDSELIGTIGLRGPIHGESHLSRLRSHVVPLPEKLQLAPPPLAPAKRHNQVAVWTVNLEILTIYSII